MAMVYVGLGSNMGDRGANIVAACRGLARLAGSSLLSKAQVYETKPVGGPSGQLDYYNTVCLLETRLEPRDFLRETQALERELGRLRETEKLRWGPRIIDIDILLWGGQVVEEPELTIPHPHLAKRAFALVPLADIDKYLVHPVADLTIEELLQRIDLDNEGLRRVSL